MTERITTKRLFVFIMLGFTLVLGIVGTLARVLYSLMMEASGHIEGTAPLAMLVEGLVLSVPVSLVTMLYLHLDLKNNRITTMVAFLKAIFVAMIAFCILFMLYLVVTRGLDTVTTIAPYSLLVIPFGALSGILLWQLRGLFGVKSL